MPDAAPVTLLGAEYAEMTIHSALQHKLMRGEVTMTRVPSHLAGQQSALHKTLFDVLEQLGPDVAYVRNVVTREKERRYLTGVDAGLLVAAGVTAAFLYGVAKGLAESLGKSLGKWLDEQLRTPLSAERRRSSLMQ